MGDTDEKSSSTQMNVQIEKEKNEKQNTRSPQ